jgi:hypothetical protein
MTVVRGGMLRQCPQGNPLGIPTEAIPSAEYDSGPTSQDNAIATSDSASRLRRIG